MGMASLATAASAAPIDDLIRAARPCESIPGFDRTDDVRMYLLDLSLRRDTLTARAEGDIACTATGAGLLRGNLTTRVLIEAELDALTCDIRSASVDLTNLGGTVAPLLANQEREVEAGLTSLLAGALAVQCAALLEQAR
jgi:hypothetical protein